MRYFSYLFLLISCIIRGQNSDVKISANTIENNMVFYAINHSNVRQEITLTITAKNLMGYQEPITKLVQANDSIHMLNLSFIKDQAWEYKTNYSYKPVPTVYQKELVRKALFEHLEVTPSKPILFYLEGCSRSAFAKETLDKKNIHYKFLNVSSNLHYKKVLMELLRLENPELKEFTYPVFIANEKLTYDINNLRWFMKNLVSNKH